MTKHLLLLPLLCLTAAGAPALWYDTPAGVSNKDLPSGSVPHVGTGGGSTGGGMNEALPIGNGRFGGLIYGGVGRERVVLNEISLWTGREISTDDYGRMGSYQMLGELLVDLAKDAAQAAATEPQVRCASGHTAYFAHEEFAMAGDGNPATKWCVEHHGQPVIWELQLPAAKALTAYTLTSADDTPARDPSTWTLSGSEDGRTWTTLDSHTNEPPFSKRAETKTFAVAGGKACRMYRLTFQPNSGVPHFQVGEIAVPGLTASSGSKPAVEASNYRRSLDLDTAMHEVTYRSGDTTFKREAFASHADGVMVLRFSADKPGACSGVVNLKGAHQEATAADQNVLSFSGALSNGLKYGTKVAVLHEGGTVEAAQGKISFAKCDSVTLLVAAGTDYVADYGRGYRGDDPGAAIDKRIAAAAAKSFDALRAAHIADYQSLFNRVALDIGATPADRLALPTDKRKILHNEQGGDADLEETLFQYGRYLMISCSRPGGLPANLQGLWNDSNNPPWHSDYHANINIQMNYWPAEPANLGECHTTLFDLIDSQLPAWRKATAAEAQFKTASGESPGWAVRTSHGINGDQGWQWDLSANAWYCQHYWMHYEFGGDKAWLKRVAYPIMKETCDFWVARLKALPDGKLVIPNGWSPEHGPHEDGVSYNQQIVWDLFNNYVAASEALGIDADYRAKIARLRDQLLGPKVGKWGQLQEWMVDRDDPNDHHRHTSHLFAVFPGKQISIVRTPEFAAAARTSLLARTEGANTDVREWSFAWRCNLYARLHDGENAHRMIQMLLADRNTCRNLFGLHPPMQMDGNFGITAGFCEMLMQSHEGEINLLPAIPAAWPAGSVKGLRARGGFTVDIDWKAGQVTSYRITADAPREVKVRVNGQLKTVTAEKR